MSRPDLFTATVNILRAGSCQEELSEALSDAVEAARETGKQAIVTLTLKIKPEGRSGQYVVHDDIKRKLPALDKGGTLLFGTPEGNLQRQDPRQTALNLKRVPDEERPTPKQVNED